VTRQKQDNDDGVVLLVTGTVEDAFIPTDRETGRSRGFGFVTMPAEEVGTRRKGVLHV
jgi:hypothetical protein